MAFDFTNIFNTIKNGIVAELQLLMNKQTGTDGSKYAGLAPSTLKAKARRNDISADVKTKRMLTTRDFQTHAFAGQALKDGIKIFVSPEQHGRALKKMRGTLEKYQTTGQHKKVMNQVTKVAKAAKREPTYLQIAQWQIATGNSTFFPQNDTQIAKLDSVKRGFVEFQKEAGRQMQKQVVEKLKRVAAGA